MTMLPVCSTTPCCSAHSQILVHGGVRAFSTYKKAFEVRCLADDRVLMGLSNGIHIQDVSFKPQATNSLFSGVVLSTEQSGYQDSLNLHPCPNILDKLQCRILPTWSASVETIRDMHINGNGYLKYVDSSSASYSQEENVKLIDQLTERVNIIPTPDNPGNISPINVITVDTNSALDPLDNVRTSVKNFLAGINGYIGDSVDTKGDAVKSSVDKIRSSIEDAIRSANEAVDNAVDQLFSAVDRTGELTGNKLESFSGDLNEATRKAGLLGVDVIRRTIFSVEDFLMNGASFIEYSYGSVKELLPPEAQNVLNTSEEKTIKILMPVGTALQQVFAAIKELEINLGLDPNDPIVPFVIFLGTSATLWIFYWRLTYGGYSGDLSPESTLQLLSEKENGVLIDVRPEDLRERNGIPDLRRAARFRYASVTLPEFSSSVQNLLKSGKELDDTLIAAVIRNLKIIQDRSKVIIMDADGNRSKGIARSLRKLGVKRPYLVQGGFRSWAKQGLRIKELKPETTLSVLNEEAEAILEDLNPTPVKVLGYSLGIVAATYSLLEWEKTLQLIGVFGLGQTIYRRVSSYEDSQDFKQDVSLLLTPVTLGVQAFSWATGKLETNGVRLPTSPSSSDVRNRVLQAAAKHESQPSDTEETQDLTSDSSVPVTENADP